MEGYHILISVKHMDLYFQRETGCIQLRGELEVEAPTSVHGLRHTGHMVWSGFPSSLQLRWSSSNRRKFGPERQ
jgi:hypothetical protein